MRCVRGVLAPRLRRVRPQVLERSDLALFAPPAWLNDRALHFAMKLLEDDSTKSWLLLDPAVYAFLMLQCDFED